MKILMVSAYPPEPAPEANHALHISEQLAKLGHSVHVLCKTGSIAPTQPGIAVHPIIGDWTWSDVPRLAQCLRTHRPDIVVLLYIGWIYEHHPMITFLPTICKRVLPGIPCVTQFEAIDCDPPRHSSVAHALRKAMTLWVGRQEVHPWLGTLLRDSARIIALSSPHRDRLLHQDPSVGDKTVILPPPPLIRMCQDPPDASRRRARAAVGATERDFVVVYWGYVYPGKGMETLLEAFRIVCSRNPNVRLIIVGGSLEIAARADMCRDYFHMVRQLSETLGIADKVTWTGSFTWDSEDGSLYLHAGDVCILPFDYGVTLNNSSLAAASTHGLPVIGTHLSDGQDEALEHGRNIYLIRPRDPEMLAEAIQLVKDVDQVRDNLRRGIVALAQQWHRWDSMTQRLIGILESTVAASPRASVPLVTVDAAESTPQWPSHREKGSTPIACELHSHGSAGSRDIDSAPFISVIVAAYNVDKYLCQCLDSLVHQTLKNIEIIVVNDASTDNSAAIIDEYALRHPQVRVFKCLSNKGLATVRNIGLANARGRYVAFVDGDDWVDVRMCETLYQRAAADNLDVLIADAIVLYDNTKTYGQHFDQHIRKMLDPRLRTRPFDLRSEPRALLLEPVAWTKIYKRSFLEQHDLRFEDGMNSYEDVCFHFSVLLKARRMSLTDETLSFYRQNRPGQISGRTSRKVFEVFAVFRKIHQNLSAWDVTLDVWAMFIKVQLRQFDWLLRDRVQTGDKLAFMASVSQLLQAVPHEAFRSVTRYTTRDEQLKLFCMRRNRLRTYERIVRHRWPTYPLLDVLVNDPKRAILQSAIGRVLQMARRRTIATCQSVATRSLNISALESQFRGVEDKLNFLLDMGQSASRGTEPLAECVRIGNQTLLFSYPAHRSSLSDAAWRMEHDYYMTRTVTFREGDVVVDVGAHVGVLSIHLARKYPFIKVFAIEPDPLNFASLQRNIERNGVTNIIAIQRAIAAQRGKAILFVDSCHSSWATIDASLTSCRKFLRTEQVETCTLDQLFREHNIRHCRLLKLTALGSTSAAFRGLTGTQRIDLLTGEVELEECSRGELEMNSWRIARQHFWRTLSRKGESISHAWIQQLPRSYDHEALPVVLEQPDRIYRHTGPEAITSNYRSDEGTHRAAANG